MNNCCGGCGGGIDNDHPTTCSACLYEQVTGRNYVRDVNNGVLDQVRRALADGTFRRKELRGSQFISKDGRFV